MEASLTEMSDADMQAAVAAGKATRVQQRQLEPEEMTDAQMQEHLKAGRAKPYKADSDTIDVGGNAKAFGEHAGDAFTAGYYPQLKATYGPKVEKVLDSKAPLAERALNYAQLALPHELMARAIQQVFNPDKDYVDRRDAARKQLEQESKDFPTASVLGTGTGIVGQALATGGLGNVARGATLGQKALAAAKMGAVMGAVANPGDTEGEINPLQLGDRAVNSALGAGAGATLATGFHGLGKAGEFVGDKLRGYAEEKAFKAMGPDFRAVRQNYEKDQIRRIGRALLDAGVIRKAPTTFEGLAERTGTALGGKGAELGNILEELGQAETKLNAQPGVKAGISRKMIADAVRKELLSSTTEIPGAAAKNAQIEGLISQFENGGDDLMGLLSSEKLKRAIGKTINWDRLPGADIPLEEQVNRSLYSNVKKGVENGADALEKMVGGPGSNRFVDAKDAYGALDTANRIAQKREARQIANRFLSPSDYGMSGLGAAAGFATGEDMEDRLKRAAIGAGAGMANKAARVYGNQIAAKGLDAAASGLSKVPAFAEFFASNPEAMGSFGHNLQSRVRGQPGFDQNDPLKNPEMLQLFERRPELIEKVQSPALREELRRRYKPQDRGPDSAPIPKEAAQQMFIEGSKTGRSPYATPEQ